MMWGRLLIHRTKYMCTNNKLLMLPACNTVFGSRMALTNNPKNGKQNINLFKQELHEKELKFGKNISNQKKKMKKSYTYVFSILGLTIMVGGTFTILYKEQYDISFWKKYYFKIWKKVEEFSLFIKEPSREKLLPDPLQYPYYQPPYTLVLEFTDVMAHPDWTYKTGWRFKKRPGLDFMLENLVGLYEIVVYTAEPGMTIFPILEAIDQKNLISYKLVRDSTHFVDGHHVKNLDKLNRDLKKVIVIDWDNNSVKFHPENHFNLLQWNGNDDDVTLIHLTSFLKTIAQAEIDDVRDVLRYYKQFKDPLMEFRNKQKEYFERKEHIPLKRAPSSLKKVFDYIM